MQGQSTNEEAPSNNSGIEVLRDLLKKDRLSRHRRYPDQAIHALRNDDVVKAIERRLGGGHTLSAIRDRGYSFLSGLVQISFEFTSRGGIGLSADAILVITNPACEVVGLVDPFDPAQPNTLLPALPPHGDTPFVLAQPSCADEVLQDATNLYPSEVRCREFFEKIGLRPGGEYWMPIGPRGPVGEGDLTACTWATTTNRAFRLGCQEITGLFFPHCDAYGSEYAEDQRIDGSIDDSGLLI